MKPSLSRHRILTSMAIIALLASVVIDLMLHYRLDIHSTTVTRDLQQRGDGLKVMSNVFSDYGVYWIFVYFYVHILIHNDHVYMLYTIYTFFVPLSIVFMLKAIYYRPRPFAIADIESNCDCDPGMPSGHASMAVSAYVIAFCHLRRFCLKRIERLIYRNITMVIFGLIFSSLVLTICASRIVLGSHTYMEVLIGALISLASKHLLSFKRFKQILANALPYKLAFSISLSLVLLIFTIGMLFINQIYRSEPKWIYLNRCPECLNSFVKGQTKNLGTVFFTIVFLGGISTRTSSTNPKLNPPTLPKGPHTMENDHPDTEIQHRLQPPPAYTRPIRCSSNTYARHILRFVITPCLISPPIILIILLEYLAFPHLSSKITRSVYYSSIILYIFYGSLSACLGYIAISLRVRVFSKCHILEGRDQLDIADLPIKQNKSIHRPDIRKQAYECELPVSGRDKQAGQADHIEDLQPRVVGLSPAIKYRS